MHTVEVQHSLGVKRSLMPLLRIACVTSGVTKQRVFSGGEGALAYTGES